MRFQSWTASTIRVIASIDAFPPAVSRANDLDRETELATILAVADRQHRLELLAVGPKDRGVLVALLDEYLAELSGHRERPVGATKAKEYRHLDAYFAEPGRHAFFVSVRSEVAGFALIRGPESTGTGWQVAEFYVEPRHRRAGLGRWTMASIWDRFAGTWELQVHATNAPAVAFWEACARASSDGDPSITPLDAPDGRRLQYEFCVKRRTGRRS